jgi:cardiolipin-specific phospholipase
MGAAQSAGLRAERELLTAGADWYDMWRKRKSAGGLKAAAGAAAAASTSFTISDVAIGEGLTIHTARYHRTEDERNDSKSEGSDVPLVCMHGFGTGLGIYYSSLPALAEKWQGSVFAIDTLGCSLSSRPRWHLEHGAACKVSEAEDFFVDGLERWRRAVGLERMVLMGHSLGGYLAVAYAERHPEHVERLILVSAVGTPEPPKELAEAHETAPLPFRMVLGAWNAGWSPFTVAKLGLGRMMLHRYVSMRFSDASWVKKPELEAYLHMSWTGNNNSAGGYAHSTLLRPGGLGELAYAREPTGPRRIPSLKVGRISAIYGDRDWMKWEHMDEAREAVRRRPGGGPEIEILHVSDANHNVQVDNPLGFADAVMATCHGKDADGKTFGREYYKHDSDAPLW